MIEPVAAGRPTATAGPWNLYIDEDGNVVSVTKWGTGPRGGHVAWSIARMTVSDHFTTEEQNANARLMMAAPDLLAACEAMLNCTVTNEREAVLAMRAAVRKAKGQHP